MSSRRTRAALAAALLLGPTAARGAEDLESAAAAAAAAAALHPAPEQAVKLFKVPPGLSVELWAADPDLQNPVGFGFDERGRIFVAESTRAGPGGALDNRKRLDWLSEAFKKSAPPERLAKIADELLDRELAARTVEDREAIIRTYMDVRTMSIRAEQVRLLEDRDGDGRADHSSVFSDGYNHILDGIASSVLVRKGLVYFANIPHLWTLRDTNGDGVADVRTSLSQGYGVRFAFYGHDLHGLRIGPDGRLYFTVGDRGATVRTREGRVLASPDTGSVFRCNLDGSALELFATGLRNPQDLAFDERGDLFTGDNNSDGGDKARWVHLVEGGDSAWRIGYQYLEAPYVRGPWNAERLWHPPWDGQAAYLVPPVANIGDGPSGVAYHPGTGLRRGLSGHFFLVDFRGQAVSSGIHAFRLKQKGASHELVAPERFLWGVLATDADFGPDGALYVLDWLQGWSPHGRGRIWRVFDPAEARNPLVAQTRKLIAEGMEKRPQAELVRLLAHADVRVRQEAQFQLAATRASGALLEAAQGGASPLARLHGVWGLGQILRASPAASRGLPEALLRLLQDRDPEVRAQSAKVLGEVRAAAALGPLVERLQDDSDRVRFFAAIALGHLGKKEAVPPLLALLRANADRDPYLRHAAVMGLVGAADAPALLAAADDPSRAVRLGVVVALRRLQSAELARLLGDRDPAVVREAARAINDVPLEPANPALAAVAVGSPVDEPLARRVINANFRLGTAEAAARVAALARRADAPLGVRAEALEALGDWASPSGRDRVTGLWRPLPAGAPRDQRAAVAAVERAAAGLLTPAAPPEIALAALGAVRNLAIAGAARRVGTLVESRQSKPAVRAEALRVLDRLRAPALARAVAAGRRDASPQVRVEALRIAVRLQPGTAPRLIDEAMARGTIPEKQAALAATAHLPAERAERLLAGWLDGLVGGKLPNEIALDVLEAAGRRDTKLVKEKLAAYEARRSDDEIGRYREALAGGDAQRGGRVFHTRADVACLRCHAIKGHGGEVGPDLDGIGARRSREHLLESVVAPNKELSPGFESVILTLKDGSIQAGILKKETEEILEILSPDAGPVVVKKADVATRERGASGMPDGLGDILSRRDLRDLIEYLASLR